MQRRMDCVELRHNEQRWPGELDQSLGHIRTEIIRGVLTNAENVDEEM